MCVSGVPHVCEWGAASLDLIFNIHLHRAHVCEWGTASLDLNFNIYLHRVLHMFEWGAASLDLIFIIVFFFQRIFWCHVASELNHLLCG